MTSSPEPAHRFSLRLRTKILLGLLAVLVIAVVWTDVVYSRIVDEKLAQGPYAGSVAIYTEPRSVEQGDALTPEAVAQQLGLSGYSSGEGSEMGYYRQTADTIEIHPGPQSYFRPDPVVIKFRDGKVAEVTRVDRTAIGSYSLEPQTLATVNAGNSGKRRLVTFHDIPKVLVNALLAIEDKHFFEHVGFDPMRLVKSAYIDIKSARKEQGGSTLTMQLARNLYLDSAKNWKRKANELMITLVLEQKLSKERIFELYANQVYLGRHYGFTIQGFGEAAHVFFRKDLRDVTLSEAAMLAGIVQRPSYFDPVNHLERATDRRNVVLTQMQQNGFITAEQESAAEDAPVVLAPPETDGSGSPYFLALANAELQAHLPETRASVSRIYTTLDPDLQKAAVEAIQGGMAQVDKLVARKGDDGERPQSALIALDPHTGAVLAAVGGRNFGASQVNHILAKRQPGSVFKPFVYAAALSPSLDGKPARFTPASTVVDEPATFRFGTQTYQPGNFGEEFHGRVTFRNALAKSMNVAAVRVAELVGYDKVVHLARAAGLNKEIQPTPAVALGAYEATPLEIAGAYTIFANQGEFVQPTFLNEAISGAGQILYKPKPLHKRVLDTGTAWVMQDMLEEVLRTGTGASVRGRGLTTEAAGKTGTSRDGWFAGFTADLLCIVWVGYDDNRDLDLEGAKSALPIWVEFMKRATAMRQSPPNLPGPPDTVVKVTVDPTTGLKAGPDCPSRRTEFFVEGSAPTRVCSHAAAVNPDTLILDAPIVAEPPLKPIGQEIKP
jgi:penicillin-binding protein 1B